MAVLGLLPSALCPLPSAAMELNSTAIHDVIHPTAAFSRNTPPAEISAAAPASVSWDDSQLNPKNRIDSLDPPLNPLWRIDGCTGLGTQYYAVPLFASDTSPMRFDVFIPEEAAAASSLLRELLHLNVAFHTKDAPRLRRLGIARYIVRALQAWITDIGFDGYATLCGALPFGSRIIFESLPFDVRKTKISVLPTYHVERQLLGRARLATSLGLAPELIPEAIDISRLRIVQELSDSVCLVRICKETGDREQAELWVLKALSSSTKYLFLELRNLLQTEPHPNVISRPQHIVTKRCQFGGKTVVVGFILPYHKPGSLRDTLPQLRIHGHLNPQQQLKWATQLASAVSHIRERGRIFYPDLRLDNILLSAAHDIVMVDFEQRGVWCEFAAPEVNAVEYVRLLASDDSDDGGPGPNSIPRETRAHFADLLHLLLPEWDVLQACEDYSTPRPRGYANYNISWLALDEVEQEAAMVYMLGRVLWCIFEGQSAPQMASVWQSYRHEPDLEFPAFRQTPHGLRGLIDRCTRGRRDELSNLVVRRGGRLVLGDEERSSTAAVLAVARKWWKAEVEAAEQFLAVRTQKKATGQWDGNHFGRPTLKEVLTELEQFRE